MARASAGLQAAACAAKQNVILNSKGSGREGSADLLLLQKCPSLQRAFRRVFVFEINVDRPVARQLLDFFLGCFQVVGGFAQSQVMKIGGPNLGSLEIFAF